MIIADLSPPRENTLIRVLFVCLGNICRSPTAEGIFRNLIDDAGLDGVIEVDSAGTSDWHIGGPPDERGQAVARSRGLDLSHLKARQVDSGDFLTFDYVIAMDSSNHKNLSALCPLGHEQRLRMCLSFVPGSRITDVPDPYYEDGFDDVFELLETAGRGLLAEIRTTHNL